MYGYSYFYQNFGVDEIQDIYSLRLDLCVKESDKSVTGSDRYVLRR